MSKYATAETTHSPPSSPVRLHTAVQRFSMIPIGFLCLFLILRYADAVISHMKLGLSLCAKTVIPSLFPFMVISELLVCSGGGELLGNIFQKPFQRLFGISGGGVCALLMGWICGFPIGAKTAVSLCKRGVITSEELSDLICYCNIPSSAFLINAVGVSLFGNRRFGLILYMIGILTSLITALILHRIHPRPAPVQPLIRMGTSAPGTLIQSITSAATAMLYVCAYILFFTALSGALGELLRHHQIGQSAIAMIFGFFELSGGIMQASSLSNPIVARQLTALLCGWSGLSVHLQILSLCATLPEEKRIRSAPYLICKVLQSIFCVIFSELVFRLLPSAQPISSMQTSSPVISPSPFVCIACFISFAMLCLVGGTVKKHYTPKKSVPLRED